MISPTDATADRDAATAAAAAAAAGRRVAGVDAHTFVEGHGALRLQRPSSSPVTGGYSFAHYDSGVAVVDQLETIAATRAGELRGTTEGGVAVWRGVGYAEQPVGERRFAAPGPRAAVDGRARRDASTDRYPRRASRSSAVAATTRRSATRRA